MRWSRPKEIVLRETDYGPVISDAPMFAWKKFRLKPVEINETLGRLALPV